MRPYTRACRNELPGPIACGRTPSSSSSSVHCTTTPEVSMGKGRPGVALLLGLDVLLCSLLLSGGTLCTPIPFRCVGLDQLSTPKVERKSNGSIKQQIKKKTHDHKQNKIVGLPVHMFEFEVGRQRTRKADSRRIATAADVPGLRFRRYLSPGLSKQQNQFSNCFVWNGTVTIV